LCKLAEDVNEILGEVISRVGYIPPEDIQQLRSIIYEKLNDSMIYGYEAKK
jgi:hypothetical protein